MNIIENVILRNDECVVRKPKPTWDVSKGISQLWFVLFHLP